MKIVEQLILIWIEEWSKKLVQMHSISVGWSYRTESNICVINRAFQKIRYSVQWKR